MSHTWIFGNPSAGKTTTLVDLALDEIDAGNGIVFLDLNGSAIDTILRHFPKRRVRDAIVLDPSDYQHPVGWNILADVPKPQRPFMTALLRDTVKALWNYAGIATPVMDRMLYNTVAALLECPGTSLLSIEPMLTDKLFRGSVLEHVSDPVLLRKWSYWNTKSAKDWDALISSTENKAGEFSEDPRIRHIVGQEHSAFDLRAALFEKKVILLRLPQSELGTAKAAMFGSLFLAHVQAVAYARTIQLPFSVFIDDFHHFDTPVLRQFLSSGSRYGISMCLANQFLAQLSPELRSSVIGNCSTRIMFQTGIEDSEYLHRTIPKDNIKLELHELEPHNTLRFDSGMLSQALGPEPRGRGSERRRTAVVTQARRSYASKLADVEASISGMFAPPERTRKGKPKW